MARRQHKGPTFPSGLLSLVLLLPQTQQRRCVCCGGCEESASPPQVPLEKEARQHQEAQTGSGECRRKVVAAALGPVAPKTVAAVRAEVASMPVVLVDPLLPFLLLPMVQIELAMMTCFSRKGQISRKRARRVTAACYDLTFEYSAESHMFLNLLMMNFI